LITHSRPTLGPEDAEAVLAVLESGQIAQGPRVAAFEEALAGQLGRLGGVATSSGTAALAVALIALGAGPGDEVIVPAYACSALGEAVRFAGASVVLADVGDELSLAPEDAARRLSARTRAIVVVHPFGHPVEVGPFLMWGIPLIEDCAQALGASRDGSPAGSRGTVAVCSFYATKVVAAGEGGVALADDESLLSEARRTRHGGTGRGFNFKMTDLAAALGLAQLARLEAFIARRRRIAERYDLAFRGRLSRPQGGEGGVEPCGSRYVVRVSDAATFVEGLGRHGIQARRAVADPLVRAGDPNEYPESARAFAECVSLPIYPSLEDEEVALVIRAVEQTLAETGCGP
jgi:perosamine synthetase